MTLNLLTPEWEKEIPDVEAVFLPGTLGEFEVLRSHAPILSTLTAGRVRYRVDGKEDSIAIKGGSALVSDNVIQVCAEI